MQRKPHRNIMYLAVLMVLVLVAVTLGGSLMGLVGMLIFIPTVSVIYTLFREWVYARLDKKQMVTL